MVAGRIVEQGATDDVLHRPLHDYTQLLLSAVPDPAAGLHADAWTGRGDIDRFRDDGTPTALVEERPGHWVQAADVPSQVRPHHRDREAHAMTIRLRPSPPQEPSLMARIGLMLYSVRRACAEDFEATLRAVAAMGTTGVEVFDLHGHDGDDVRGWLDELGLVPCGLHAPLDAVEADLAGLAATARGARDRPARRQLGEPADARRPKLRAIRDGSPLAAAAARARGSARVPQPRRRAPQLRR